MAGRYTVKAVAELAGISVRTLHHYDHIGLLTPAATTEAGYRLYSDRDIERLQQILFFRELGFELRTIREILDRPDFDEHRALLAHRELLIEKQNRLGQLIRTIDESLASIERKDRVVDRTMFEGFDSRRAEEQIARYRDEAIQKYGEEAVESSERQVRSLTDSDWQRLEREISDISLRMTDLMDSHEPASPEVQQQVKRWFDLLNKNFADYSPEMFAGLGNLYVQDERFTTHYDQIRPGLARFFRDGMQAFAENHGARE